MLKLEGAKKTYLNNCLIKLTLLKVKIFSLIFISSIIAFGFISCQNTEDGNASLFQVNLEKAKQQLIEDNYEDALVYLNRCLKLEPENCDALKGVIVAKSELKDFLGVVGMKHKLDCYKARHLFEIGYAYEKLDDTDEAIKYYLTSIRADSLYLAANNNLANLYMNLQKMDSALFWFKKGFRIDSTSLEINVNMGVLFGDIGQLNTSIYHLNKAINLCPTCDNLYYSRGIVKYNLGDVKEAISDLNISIEMNSENDIAWLNRGLIYYNLEKIDQACKDFKRAKNLGNAQGLRYYNELCL